MLAGFLLISKCFAAFWRKKTGAISEGQSAPPKSENVLSSKINDIFRYPRTPNLTKNLEFLKQLSLET